MATYEELKEKAQAAWRPLAEPERPLIKVGVTTCSRAVGARETLDAVRVELAARGPSTGSGQALEAEVMVTGCWGLCYIEPIVEVVRPGRPGVLYGKVTADKVPQLIEGAVAADGVVPELALAVLADEPLDGLPSLGSLEFFAGQERRLMANCGVTDPDEIDHYIARGGYEGLAKALAMSDEQVISEVLESGLWGRGGAAFPTGRKWDFLRGAEVTPKYMICNADEGDPGSFVNRNLMESYPHLTV
ncbi:MAG: NADH-quinone oxidoreductase subunit F, partial [Chloroflexi bacterium]|nr:NADH-quinone oxidoreductase subunit F [Chloroflexota bacterium]